MGFSLDEERGMFRLLAGFILVFSAVIVAVIGMLLWHYEVWPW